MQITEVRNQLVSTIALVDDENKILIGKALARKKVPSKKNICPILFLLKKFFFGFKNFCTC